ncbi:MAG: hypothetical protein WBN96_09950, partial [Gammaproteobacteria bacterium]
PAVLVTIVFYLISQLLVGVWWASDTSARLNQVLDKIEHTGKDRFYGRDGTALKEYVRLNIELLNKTIDYLDNRITTHDIEATKYKKLIDQVHLEQAKIREKVDRMTYHMKDPTHRANLKGE